MRSLVSKGESAKCQDQGGAEREEIEVGVETDGRREEGGQRGVKKGADNPGRWGDAGGGCRITL